MYVEESYKEIGLGPMQDKKDEDEDEDYEDEDEETDVIFESPKETSRSGPFSIDLDFTTYRKNREYKSNFYELFLSTSPFRTL